MIKKASTQNKTFRVETSRALDDLFYKYTHLSLGEKKIVCPYWINNLKLGVFGPYGGKGTPEQIVEATEAEAEKISLDLNKLTKEEILAFMKNKRLGVDCSGFVFWMLDTLDREKGGNGIADDIPGSSGRFLPARANVMMLSSDEVSLPVKLKEVKVGDMIRLNNGKHVVIILRILRNVGDLEKVKEIEYAHSSGRTKIQGVHLGRIKVNDSLKGLEAQLWEEKAIDGQNYGQTNYLSQAGDNIRRLKIWA